MDEATALPTKPLWHTEGHPASPHRRSLAMQRKSNPLDLDLGKKADGGLGEEEGIDGECDEQRHSLGETPLLSAIAGGTTLSHQILAVKRYTPLA